LLYRWDQLAIYQTCCDKNKKPKFDHTVFIRSFFPIKSDEKIQYFRSKSIKADFKDNNSYSLFDLSFRELQ